MVGGRFADDTRWAKQRAPRRVQKGSQDEFGVSHQVLGANSNCVIHFAHVWHHLAFQTRLQATNQYIAPMPELPAPYSKDSSSSKRRHLHEGALDTGNGSLKHLAAKQLLWGGPSSSCGRCGSVSCRPNPRSLQHAFQQSSTTEPRAHQKKRRAQVCALAQGN